MPSVKIVQLNRGRGKTRYMTNWLIAGAPDRILLVADATRRSLIHKCLSRHFGTPDKDSTSPAERDRYASYSRLAAAVVLPHELQNLWGRRYQTTMGIDDLDDVLPILFGRPVELVTVSLEEETNG